MSYFEGIFPSPTSSTLLLAETGVCYVLELLPSRKHERNLWSKRFSNPGMVSKRMSHPLFVSIEKIMYVFASELKIQKNGSMVTGSRLDVKNSFQKSKQMIFTTRKKF